MTKEQKMNVAVFRYGVISDFVSGASISRLEKRTSLEDKSAKKWRIPFSEKTRISKSSRLRWIRLYEKGGHDIASLHPNHRQTQGRQRSNHHAKRPTV